MRTRAEFEWVGAYRRRHELREAGRHSQRGHCLVPSSEALLEPPPRRARSHPRHGWKDRSEDRADGTAHAAVSTARISHAQKCVCECAVALSLRCLRAGSGNARSYWGLRRTADQPRERRSARRERERVATTFGLGLVEPLSYWEMAAAETSTRPARSFLRNIAAWRAIRVAGQG